ncbi:MAG TPA: signal recognition particle protein Srp54 [Candidatus Nanoarchaeia archaeon]|nr:signal recognition particle protein Srp54 [Candidatus Nanoarchaeia archaeon]
MVLEKLGESLRNTFGKITNALFVDEKLINELVREIQRALLQSDVNVKLVFALTERIKVRAKQEEAPGALSKKEWLIKIVYDELVNFLGAEEGKIEPLQKPFTIMLVGLFGNGKTTTAGKLAKYFQKRGKSVALISTDTWRPAAFAQLEQIGKQLQVPVFGDPKQKNPERIYQQYAPELKKFDVVIVDSAGRDALSAELITELNALNAAVKADERLLVISADIGQAAERQAKAFHDSVQITGVIITKMDGTAKGGGALAACAVTGAKVKFIGVGEKIDDLEQFRPKNFVGRMLGMGDLESLLEKAQEAISEDEAKDLSKKLLKGEFNLLDLYEQMEAMNKMGPLNKLVEMIPGFSQVKLPKEVVQVQEGKLKKWRYAMDSMTKGELEDPDLIDAPRIDRIKTGSGISVTEIRELLKQYRMGKKMVKMFKGMSGSEKDMQKMMKKMQGMNLGQKGR